MDLLYADNPRSYNQSTETSLAYWHMLTEPIQIKFDIKHILIDNYIK